MLDTTKMDSEEKELWKMLTSKFEGEELIRVLELITIDSKKFQKENILNSHSHSVSDRFSDEKFIGNVCLSYRQDYGLLSKEEQNKVRIECKEWMRAIENNEPYGD